MDRNLALQVPFDEDYEGGRVVVTRFECNTYAQLVVMLVLHQRVKRAVRRDASGLLAATLVVDWRRKVMLSISLWQDQRSIYTMGEVYRHIVATRLPSRWGIRTASGIFAFAGDWRAVMFDSHAPRRRSPLFPLSKSSA